MVKGQLKIQQMAFMIIAVFFFFILVGLAYLGFSYRSAIGDYETLQKEQALKSLQTLIDMPELSCGYQCLDEDKLYSLSSKKNYDLFPVASIKVYKLYPFQTEKIPCPGPDCNYYEIYNSGQSRVREYATFVSICKQVRENGYAFNRCEIGKMAVGVVLPEVEE
jgi:hypothetical protein